jgi:5-methylcytosine-specific restriction endonuclease McrA
MKYKHHSRHHIIPKSRGGDNSLENIAVVNSKEHQLYHNLFSNRRPEEIINYLVNEFWNEDWKYVNKAMRKYKK